MDPSDAFTEAGKSLDGLATVVDVPHVLRGTLHADNADEAERKCHEAARAWFGDAPYRLTISVSTCRDIGDHVLYYEVDYEAAPR